MDQLPVEILCTVFKYLRQIDLIEASSVCKLWHNIIQTEVFRAKLKETENLFHDRPWLLKTYFKHFERFAATVYWECVGAILGEVLPKVETEILDRMFYSVFPFRVWSHF